MDFENDSAEFCRSLLEKTERAEVTKMLKLLEEQEKYYAKIYRRIWLQFYERSYASVYPGF